jgi:ArsR family transcriptional regulator, lead/cadmium/zinc/bismuth-responsive transcriptional repressor
VADDRCDLLCLELPQAEALRHRRLSTDDATRRAGRARGLADPTRLMLAASLLGADELCVCDLSWISERSANLVSHHLRVLRTEGLVSSRRDGKLVIYSLTAEGRALVRAVLGDTEGAIG